MATKAELQAQLQALEQAAAPYLQAARDLSGGNKPGGTSYATLDDLSNPKLDDIQLLFRRFALPPPSQRVEGLGVVPEIVNNLNKVVDYSNQAAVIYNELYPVGGGLSDLEIFGIFVAAAATFGAAEIALGGAGAAGAATGSAAAASTPTLTTIGTQAAIDTTAGAVTTPIVVDTGAAVTGATVATATSAASVASSVGTAVTDLTGSSTAGSVVSSVVSGIGNLVGDVENILKPVTGFAQTVLSDVETINKDYVVPITTAISKDYTTITGLIGEVDQLSKAGIQGILAIPSAIGSALTSIDASNLRLAQLNQQANQGIAANTLVPGIGGAISEPLANIHGVLNDAFNQPIPDAAVIRPEPLSEADFAGFNPEQTQADAIAQLGKIKVLGPIVVGVLTVWKGILQFIGYLESWVSFSEQAGRLAQPIEPLDIEEVVRAWRWGLIDEPTALFELKRHGVDETRAHLLYEQVRWLPSTGEAVRMFYQGILSSEQVSSALSKQGLSAADVQAVLDTAPARPDPREAITLNGRASAAQAGFISQSLLSECPDQYKLLYPPRLEDAARAGLDWQAHWNIPDIHWWSTALFRGAASQEEFNLAAQALNFPPEVIPNLPFMDQETIQLWMIPDMIATNLFTVEEAASYLAYIGLAPRDAQILIKYGQSKAGAGQANDALGLGTLSIGLAAEMFDDGIINESEYVDILEAHKLTPEAAALTIKLTQQKAALAERRANAQSLVKQVDSGALDLQTMTSQLYAAGYTQLEVETYTALAQKNAISKAKFPTEAQIKAFHAAGILTDDGALSALQVAGWSPEWAQAFITLWGIPSGTKTNTGSTQTTGG